ncbi:hypothetical protein RINTHM_7360 [Richelia intracellularis HM01]|uniref:ABC transporter permease n=1 Tax=Richelia intracellularis TaxID=1164990 RepID=UPI0002B4F3EB|nr:ABC transporter permease [Richelia intracellularis]CCH65199.1 hypothetical protein RINTHM_7360 [Richelia intracellularis HM01]
MGHKIVVFTATFILFISGLLLGYVISQLVLGFLPLNLLTFLGAFSLITIFGIVYYGLFWDLKKQQSQSPSIAGIHSPSVDGMPYNKRNKENQPSGTLNPSLENKLVNLLNGDVNVAERLVNQVKQDYPGMPENWYWERVIADLERDRR